jgi:hypothetical protein
MFAVIRPYHFDPGDGAEIDRRIRRANQGSRLSTVADVIRESFRLRRPGFVPQSPGVSRDYRRDK